jgi:glycerol-3-phosphate dehydrogenase
MLSKKAISTQYPMLKNEGLKGGFYYYDALTNDARLTNEVIMEACALGGVAINYLAAKAFHKQGDKISSITVKDAISGDEFQVNSDFFISAAGVWTDEILHHLDQQKAPMMLPGKGIHLVVDGARFPEKDVLLIPCTDKRFIWICPWVDGLVIIGATDTPYHGALREPGATQEDIDYVLHNVNQHLQGFQLTEQEILSVFSGLRPLIDEQGAENSTKVSRDYKIWWERANLLMIAGGKFTSFLSMADHLLDQLSSKVKLNEAKEFQLPRIDKNNYLSNKWGNSAMKVKAILDENPDNHAFLVEGLDYQLADFIFYIRYQHAQKLSDILTRRMSITYRLKTVDEAWLKPLAKIMQQELGWTETQMGNAIQEYKVHWETLQSWNKSRQ